MRYDWIIEVLQDMKAFSEKHGMVALARKVDETIRVAEAEIAVASTNHPDDADGGTEDGRADNARRRAADSGRTRPRRIS